MRSLSLTSKFRVLSLQHQTQVAMAVDRAKQITMAELNAVMQVSSDMKRDSNQLDKHNFFFAPFANVLSF